MSLAFQALVILILVLPGIIFSRNSDIAAHLRESRSIPDELAHGVTFAAFLHAVWGCLFTALGCRFGIGIDLESVILLALGQFGDKHVSLDRAVRSLSDYPYFVLLYFGSLYVAAAFAGRQIGKLRRKYCETRWMKRLEDLVDRGPNVHRWTEWEKDLRNAEEKKIVDAKLFAAVVVLGSTPYLYVGLLIETKYDETGVPDRFLLSGAHRRKLDGNEDFFEIKSEQFILRMSEILTINLWWAALDTEEDATTAG